MRRHLWLNVGLIVAATLLSASGLRAGEPEAYRIAGDLAVMDRGRVKPFHTLAIERVKSIYSRQTIKLVRPDETTESWGPVAAVLDWSARPEFWNDQEFILVEYLPLKKLLLGNQVRDAIRSVASQPDLPAADRTVLEQAADASEATQADLARLSLLRGLSKENARTLAAYAHKLALDNKWLAPSDLENAEFEVEGETLGLVEWFGNILQKREKVRAQSLGASARLGELEEKASEVAERLVTYQAIRDGNPRQSRMLDIDVVPRPSNSAYLQFTGNAYRKEMASQGTELTPLERIAADGLDRYLRDLQGKDRALPGQPDSETLESLKAESEEVRQSYLKRQEEFNQRFARWLREKSDWIPLRVVIHADPAELKQAGFPIAEVEAFRGAYAGLLEAEKKSPGDLPVDRASTFLAAARKLGTDLGRYPTAADMARESHFNRFAPFYRAPMLFGLGVVLLLVSLGIAAEPGSSLGRFSGLVYWAGMAAFLGGILLEVYGFYLRVRISGWAPVTNMYETVIWVALVTSVIGLALELISRKKFPALAASGVAMLATVLAANVSLLDPTIGSLQPVLRSNYWLTIHVLTIVSSYAAFALALGLGLIAVGFYLTASYRSTARPIELVAPLPLGGLLLALGGLCQIALRQQMNPAFFESVPGHALRLLLIGAGIVLLVGPVFALAGEYANRSPRRTAIVALLMALGGGTCAAIARLGAGPAWLQDDLASYTTWSIAIVGLSWMVLALFGSLARATLSASRSQLSLRDAADREELASHGATESRAAMAGGGGVATIARPTVAEIRARLASGRVETDARSLAMQTTAGRIKPLAAFIYRAMQVGVLLCAAGTILGGVWADYSWGRFWGWDPKEVWALITLLVYLVPLHGRFAGWVNTFGLVVASVVCFLSVLMAWYGVNFLLGVGLHSYGFVEGGSQGIVGIVTAAVLGVMFGAGWRRHLSSRQVEPDVAA